MVPQIADSVAICANSFPVNTEPCHIHRITGAPKVRAMEIIDELEPVARGFYTGAIGFIGFDDRAIFNLAIRTAIATSEQIAYHAGGGIVADSTADREFSETLLKARPFFTAVLGGSRS